MDVLKRKKFRYKLDDYFDSLKEQKFYYCFIEIYAISKINNKPIIILKTTPNNSFYILVACYLDENDFII